MTTARASHSTPTVSMSSLAVGVFANLSHSMREELCRQAAAGGLLLRSALESLFQNRLGGQQPSFDRIRFLFFAAPLVRRLVIASANLNGRIGATDVTFADVKSWLEWLDSMDPMCARMIDLRYFAGLSIKETAGLLKLPPSAVVRELRFARAWLRIKVSPDEESSEVPEQQPA